VFGIAVADNGSPCQHLGTRLRTRYLPGRSGGNNQSTRKREDETRALGFGCLVLLARCDTAELACLACMHLCVAAQWQLHSRIIGRWLLGLLESYAAGAAVVVRGT
jgi:hypothetical protein